AIVQGAGGPKAMIAGHRVSVMDVVIWHEKLRLSVDEILDRIPTISHADIYAALAYYWDNREAVEQRIATDDAFVEEMRRNSPTLEEHVKSRRAGAHSIPA
ncbi:MAG: hypothetical protein DCC58_20350, partial [Chloroflexi bacterium]